MKSGWLIIDKPLNMTSAQVVARVRKLLEKPKIGHAGTLDPLASGILPLAINEATKTIPFVMSTDKEYIFEITWGTQKTTDDAEGTDLFTSTKRPTFADIQDILPQFQGEIAQTPPTFSALKIGGKRAYDLARSGQEVNVVSRPVLIHALSIYEYVDENRCRFHVHCGKGTYVRSIARDMGALLGCYGYVSALRRTKVGKFDEHRAILLDNLEKNGHKIGSYLLSISDALDDIPGIGVGEKAVFLLRRGLSVELPANCQKHAPGTIVLCLHDTQAVALAYYEPNGLRPFRVFNC